MRFGGHETFAIREGWLYKGLRLLKENPDLLYDEYVADHLGVGRNMAKSIRHWMLATELATPILSSNGRKTVGMEVSTFGNLVWDRDAYFLEDHTWWMVHINLVTNPRTTAAWDWFFNDFRQRRFDRPVALEALRRHTEVNEKRSPSIKTLQRDLAALLATYSRPLPAENVDPEDSNASPLRDLGLVDHFRHSGMYQLSFDMKRIPVHVLGYSLARAAEIHHDIGADHQELTLLEASRLRSGPCRTLVLTAESLFETVVSLEAQAGQSAVQIVGHAGERAFRLPRHTALRWAQLSYSEAEGGQHAA